MRSPSELEELARGKWPSLLGRWLTERDLAGKPGPCPLCKDGRDRWRFDDKDGRGTWLCSHCGAGSGFHFLQQINGWTFSEAAKYVAEHSGKFTSRPAAAIRGSGDIKEALQVAWNGARRVESDDPVGRYLAGRCGGPTAFLAFPACLRYHPALPYRHDDGSTTAHPAMLAQVLGADGKGVSVHRTYLSLDGTKAAVPTQRKLMTPTAKMSNVAIRLAPIEAGWLGVAEGIETALCASKRHGVPVWSCTSAGLLRTFRPPDDVKLLFIFGDNDKSFTGQAAAYELARAVTTLGVEVKVLIPDAEGTDWADASGHRSVAAQEAMT